MYKNVHVQHRDRHGNHNYPNMQVRLRVGSIQSPRVHKPHSSFATYMWAPSHGAHKSLSSKRADIKEARTFLLCPFPGLSTPAAAKHTRVEAREGVEVREDAAVGAVRSNCLEPPPPSHPPCPCAFHK